MPSHSETAISGLAARQSPTPDVHADEEAREAVRQHGLIRVTINCTTAEGYITSTLERYHMLQAQAAARGRNTRAVGFTEEFTDLDRARAFVRDHRYDFHDQATIAEYLHHTCAHPEEVRGYHGREQRIRFQRAWRPIPGLEDINRARAHHEPGTLAHPREFAWFPQCVRPDQV